MAELNKKDVQNNKEEVPFAHYEARFRELDPEEAAQRCGVKFENGAFTVTLLGDEYVITWPEYTISADNPRAFARKNIPTQTFLLRYLLEGKKAGPWLSFKTFREMPWGELYISPYTGRVLTRAAFTFGTRVGKFAAAWAARESSTGTRGMSLSSCRATGCRSWSTPGTTSSHPAARCCILTTSRPDFPPKIAWSQAIS